MTDISRNQAVAENFNANSVQRAARARMRRLRIAAVLAAVPVSAIAARTAWANTADPVVAGATDLGTQTTATYTTAPPTTTSDVEFLAATTYTNAGSLLLSAGTLSIGTLDDLNATALTINASQSLTLNGGVNSLGTPPSTVPNSLLALNYANPSDLLYVAPGGTLTIGGTGGIVLGTSGDFDIASTDFAGTAANGAATINSVIFDGGHGYSLTKTGVGTLTLTAANTYTGATSVVQGGLTLNFAATGAPTSNIINQNSALTLGGYSTSGGGSLYAPAEAAENPTLLLVGANTTAGSNQTFAGLTVNPGTNQIIARGGTSSGNMAVALGAITLTNGGSISFSRTTGGSTGVGAFTTTTLADANTGLISGVGGAAVISSASAPNQATFQVPTDYATVVSGQIVPYTGYTVVGTASGYGTTSAPTIASNTTNNLKIDSTSSAPLTYSGGGTTISSKTLTVTSTNGLFVGAVVTGTGIPANSTVTGVTNATTFTISSNATATNTGLTITETSSAIPLTATGTTDVNTILMSDSTVRDVNVGSGNTLRFGASGGILSTGGSFYIGNTPASGGTAGTAGSLTAGGTTANNPGTLNLELGTGLVIIDSNIVNNGSGANGAVTLVINEYAASSNNNAVTLGGTNTYSGGTYINSGRVTFGNGAVTPFGTGTVTIGPAGQISGGGTFANNFVIEGSGGGDSGLLYDTPGAGRGVSISGTITLEGDAGFSAGGTYSGQITGPGGLMLGRPGSSGASGGTFNLNNPSTAAGTMNNYQGNTVLTEGTTVLGANNVIPSANTLAADTGNLILTTLPNNGSAVLNLNGKNNAINGLSGFVASGTTVGVLAGIIANSSNGSTSALTLGYDNATAAYPGAIANNIATSGTGLVSITKVGSGVETFSGANTFSGGLTVNGGTLFASGAAGTPATGLVGSTSSSSNQTVVTLTSGTTAGLAVGQGVSGGTTAIPSGAVITGITSSTTFTISSNATATTTGNSLTLTKNYDSLGTGAVTVNTSGVLDLGAVSHSIGGAFSISTGTVQDGSLAVAGASMISGTNTFGFNVGATTSSQLTLAGTVTASGTDTVPINLTGRASSTTPYTLISAPSGGLSGATFSLGSITGTSTFGLSFSLATTSTALTLTESVAPTPGVAYFQGGLGTSFSSNNGTYSNFSSDSAGTTLETQLPGAATNVHFYATSMPMASISSRQEFMRSRR
jgi:fibronectin-binding autotransporter adhesin